MDKFYAWLAVGAVCSALVIANDSDNSEALNAPANSPEVKVPPLPSIVDLSPKLPKPPPNSAASEVSNVPHTDPVMEFSRPILARGNKPLPSDWKQQNAEVDMPIPKDWNEQ